jgi:hypothetical protein
MARACALRIVDAGVELATAAIAFHAAQTPVAQRERLLMPEEAADLLRVGTSSLDQIVDRGELEVVRIQTGDGLRAMKRYRADAIQEYIDRRRTDVRQN